MLRDLVLGKRHELFYKQNMKCGAVEASAIPTRHGLASVSTGKYFFFFCSFLSEFKNLEHWRNCMSPLMLRQPSIEGCTGLERLILFLLVLMPLLFNGHYLRGLRLSNSPFRFIYIQFVFEEMEV